LEYKLLKELIVFYRAGKNMTWSRSYEQRDDLTVCFAAEGWMRFDFIPLYPPGGQFIYLFDTRHFWYAINQLYPEIELPFSI